MSEILLLGMNHKTAPVEIREVLTLSPTHVEKVFDTFRRSDHIKEGIFFSTCNRFEVLVATYEPKEALEEIICLYQELGGLSRDQLLPHLYQKQGAEAVRHLLMVTASLDSMVVGEPQILGQIKASYRLAVQNRTTGTILNRLMHRAFHTAKRIRTETGISESAVSVSFAAVELARKIFLDLKGKKGLLVGAGEMGELAARHLIKNGIESLGVVNRTLARAFEVAGPLSAKAFSLDELGELLKDVDIVIASTASNSYVITQDMVKAANKKRRDKPLFIIDISVPRNVDPSINKISNVYLYDIDDLKGVIEYNMKQREVEAVKAQRITEEEAYKYLKWKETLQIVPVIVSLKKKANQIVQSELRKSRGLVQHLSEDDKEALNILVKSVAEKIINDPILFLKEKCGHNKMSTFLDFTQKLFNLDQVQNGNGKEEDIC